MVIFANFCSLNIPIMVDFKLIRTLPNEQLGSDDHTKRRRFNPWVKKILWRRKWQPTPVFLPGKSHGQRSLAGYSPWGHKESDTTEVT